MILGNYNDMCFVICQRLRANSMRRREFILDTAGAIAGIGLTDFANSNTSIKLATVDAQQYRLYGERRRFAQTSFGEIAYIEAGNASRAALFLHGFPLNSFQWRDVIDRLRMYRRCIAPDFLALGYTKTAQGQEVGPEAQVAMLAAFLDRLGISIVDIVANDSGGAIAQLFIVKYPQRVRTVLLTNCDTEINSPPAALLPVIELAKQGKYADQWLGAWLADKALARSKNGIGGFCYSNPAQPTDEAIVTYFAPLVASAQRKALVEAYVIALERNPLAGIEADLRRSIVPVRIVWGMADNIFATSDPEYLNRIFSQSRGVRRLQEGKLFWPEEYPNIVAEEAVSLWNVGILCPDNQC